MYSISFSVICSARTSIIDNIVFDILFKTSILTNLQICHCHYMCGSELLSPLYDSVCGYIILYVTYQRDETMLLYARICTL